MRLNSFGKIAAKPQTEHIIIIITTSINSRILFQLRNSLDQEHSLGRNDISRSNILSPPEVLANGRGHTFAFRPTLDLIAESDERLFK
jgi:hypothetical protein